MSMSSAHAVRSGTVIQFRNSFSNVGDICKGLVVRTILCLLPVMLIKEFLSYKHHPAKAGNDALERIMLLNNVTVPARASQYLNQFPAYQY